MMATFLTRPAASAEDLAGLWAAWPSLPDDYRTFLAWSDGAEGDLGVEPGWFVVWSAAEAMSLCREFGEPEFLPGFFVFGSNGGGELFVMPLFPAGVSRPVFMVPAIGMDPESLVRIADDFSQFATLMGRALSDVEP